MPKEFIMRGKTPSGTTEILEFGSQARPGYGYRLTEFQILSSTDITQQTVELAASITADNSHEDPANPNFNNDGLIATAIWNLDFADYQATHVIINDLFVITQDLILAVVDTKTGSPQDVNWQCRFEEIKLSGAAEAVANFKQYSIYNTSQ